MNSLLLKVLFDYVLNHPEEAISVAENVLDLIKNNGDMTKAVVALVQAHAADFNALKVAAVTPAAAPVKK